MRPRSDTGACSIRCFVSTSQQPSAANAGTQGMVPVCYNGCVDNTRLTRRATLAGIGGGALLALSGCFFGDDDDDDDDDFGSSSKKKSKSKSKSKKKK